MLLVTQACGAGWHRPAQLTPGPLRPRQQVLVWRHREVVRWHAVVLSQDSISGVPFTRPIGCDACRSVFPITEVDSIRLGNPVAGFWKSVGLALGGLLAVCIATCPRHLK